MSPGKNKVLVSAERLEQARGQCLLERHPGDHLHQPAEHDVATVAVRPQPAGRGDQRQVRQRGDVPLHAVVAPTAGEILVEAVAVDAGDVGEDLTARQGLRHRRVGERQLRQVRAKREIDVDQPVVHQLHHRRGGVALADRTGLEQRVAHDRQTGAEVGRASRWRPSPRRRHRPARRPRRGCPRAAHSRSSASAISSGNASSASPRRSHVPSPGSAREPPRPLQIALAIGIVYAIPS